MINVWTDQQNTKTNKRILGSEEEAAAARLRINGSNNGNFNVSQGKFTQNSQLALNKLATKFNNQLTINDQPGSSSVSDVNSFLHRPITQSNSAGSQSDSHNNYVEIDTLETLLYKNQQQPESDNFPQYSNTPYNPQAPEFNENQHEQLASALSSPIYENQAIVRRSESPIYSNTHNSQSISSLYSSQSQNLYSNLPSGLTNNSATAAYANLPSTSLHHGLVPASK